jgi:hypothetical protein
MVALLPGVTLLNEVTDKTYLSDRLVKLIPVTLSVLVPAFALVQTIEEVEAGFSLFTVPENEIAPPVVAVVPLKVLLFTVVTEAGDIVIFDTVPAAVLLTVPVCTLLVISQEIVLPTSLAVRV